jgi:uncharacterized iron-regulated protein
VSISLNLELTNETISLMSSKSTKKATREWVQLHKKLYVQAKTQVFQNLGKVHFDFESLEKKYNTELKQPWRIINKDLLLSDLKTRDLILMGDFHALQQSQKSQLRILRDLKFLRNIVLAVEFFQTKHQSHIDEFLNGEISSEELRTRVNWDKNWGFPWSHYLPLIEWAKENKVPIYGLDWSIQHQSFRALALRENFSAVQIKKIRRKHSKSLIAVIYGELHLSKKQFPVAIQKNFKKNQKLNVIRIYQNYEPIYFQLASRALETHAEYVRFKSGDFCVLSVPPWVKWQNYLLYLEQNFDKELDDLDIDYTDHVVKLVHFLRQALNLRIGTDSISIYTVGDEYFYRKIKSDLTPLEFTRVKTLIAKERSFFIPKLQMGYLARMSLSHTSILAAEYMHAEIAHRQNLSLCGKSDFLKQIWLHAMKYFGAKLINHKRKTDSLEDIRRSLLEKDNKDSKNKKALMLSLQQKVIEVSYLTTGRKPKYKFKNMHPEIFWDAARLLGGMMGEKYFNAFHRGILPKKQIVKLLMAPIEAQGFEKFYYRQVEVIEAISKK